MLSIREPGPGRAFMGVSSLPPPQCGEEKDTGLGRGVQASWEALHCPVTAESVETQCRGACLRMSSLRERPLQLEGETHGGRREGAFFVERAISKTMGVA